MATKNIAKKNDVEDIAESNEDSSSEVVESKPKTSKHAKRHAKKASKKEAKVSKKQSKHIGTGKIVFLVLVGIFILIAIIGAVYMLTNKAPAKVDDKLAAKVNGEEITLAELNNIYSRLPPQTQAAVKKQDVLDQMINEKLLMQAAKKQGLSVNQSEVDAFLTNLLTQSGLTKTEFNSRLALQNITEKMVYDEIYKQLLITQLYQKEIIDKSDVSQSAIQDYYNANIADFKTSEEVKASHILICYDKSYACKSNLTKQEAYDKLEAIKAQATSANFADLAKENSQDPSSGNGGDLGFFGKGAMVKPFEDAAFALKVGEISDVVETEYGFHLILLTDKKAATVLTLDEVSSEIKQTITSTGQQDAFKVYLEGLKAAATIDNFYNQSISK